MSWYGKKAKFWYRIKAVLMGRKRPAFFQMWHLVQYIISKTLGQIGSELEPGKKVKIRWLLSMKSLLSFFFFLWFRYIWLYFWCFSAPNFAHQNLMHCLCKCNPASLWESLSIHQFTDLASATKIWPQQPRSGFSNQNLASAT